MTTEVAMDQARSGRLRLAVESDTDEWTEAQRAIQRAKGLEEAVIERQLQELDDAVVGSTASELARLRGDPLHLR
jgi:hypothetical protein